MPVDVMAKCDIVVSKNIEPVLRQADSLLNCAVEPFWKMAYGCAWPKSCAGILPATANRMCRLQVWTRTLWRATSCRSLRKDWKSHCANMVSGTISFRRCLSSAAKMISYCWCAVLRLCNSSYPPTMAPICWLGTAGPRIFCGLRRRRTAKPIAAFLNSCSRKKKRSCTRPWSTPKSRPPNR